MEQIEEWRPIVGYEGLYEVSNKGHIYSHYLKRQLSCWADRHGYIHVCLRKNVIKKYFMVHRLVAAAFLPNPENKEQVDHINTIASDNRVENLAWSTPKENSNNPLSRQHSSVAHSKIRWTEERKKKMSEKMRGENNPCYGKKFSRTKARKGAKPVAQYTKDGMFIKRWDSIGMANRALGLKGKSISNCCNNRAKTAHGFVWRYILE